MHVNDLMIGSRILYGTVQRIRDHSIPPIFIMQYSTCDRPSRDVRRYHHWFIKKYEYILYIILSMIITDNIMI